MQIRVKSLIAPLVMTSLCAAAAGEGEIGGVRLVDKTYDHLSGEIGLVIRNDTDKTVTAWRMSLVEIGDDEAQNVELDFDYHIRLHHSSPQSGRWNDGPLLPGESRHLHLPAAMTRMPLVDPPPLLSLKLVAVVFEDGSAEGNHRGLAKIAADREAAYGEVASTLQSARELLSTGGGPRDAALALERHSQTLHETGPSVDAGPSDSHGTSIASAKRTDLAQLLESVSRAVRERPESTEAYIGALISDLEREKEFRLRHLLFEPASATPKTESVSPNIGEDLQ